VAWLPEPGDDDAGDLAHAEAAARRLAARQTSDALEVFEHLPGVRAVTVERVRETFRDWEAAADRVLAEFDDGSDRTPPGAARAAGQLLARAASARQLRELVAAASSRRRSCAGFPSL
jgi:hypothetical protein